MSTPMLRDEVAGSGVVGAMRSTPARVTVCKHLVATLTGMRHAHYVGLGRRQ